jgi:electron transfer flavoprotein alpha subunit
LRPIYAGNAISTVSTKDKLKLLTIRATNFEKIIFGDKANEYPVEEAAPNTADVKGKWVENNVS